MKKISNYEELVAERMRLEYIIADRKQMIHDKIENVKGKFSPLLDIMSAFKSSSSNNTPKNTTLWKAGTSVAIDLLVGQRMLKHASWFTKLVVPSLLKAFSAKVIETVKK